MIDYCYHTHTSRCGHAYGQDEEYVISAIEKGYKVIGFSDHVFLPNVIQEGIRGRYEELDNYINSINYLKEKYKDKIEIHLGFECEYSDKFKEYYEWLKKEKGFEYFILGQHLFFIDDKQLWLASFSDHVEGIKLYCDTIIKGIKTGLFTYIAHPDLFIRFFKEIPEASISEIRRLCECAEEYQIPFEINLGSLRDNRDKQGVITYPYEDFFKIVSEYNIPVIIGIDAHSPNDFDPNFSNIAYAEDLAKRLNLKLLNRIHFQ